MKLVKSIGTGLLILLVQTILETVFVIILVYLGIEYLGINPSEEAIDKLVLNMFLFYIPNKLVHAGWIYIILFMTLTFTTRLNYLMLNLIISPILFIGIALILGGELGDLINPISSSLLSAVAILILGKMILKKAFIVSEILDRET